jgi:molecular chaperone GrpE
MSKHHHDKHAIPETPAPPPAESTPAPVAPDATAALEAAATQAAENWDKYLRAVADLDNYRKRALRDRDEQIRAASERIVAALLPVLDNLERALATTNEVSPLLDGLKQVQTQFRRTLEEFGLKEVIAHSGHPFDPHLHEAVSQTESPEHPDGVILELLQRGYKLADRLLRPARVVVSKGAPVTADSANEADPS